LRPRSREAPRIELSELATLSPAQLEERWALLEKSVPPSVPTPLFRRLLAQRLQERRYRVLPAVIARELERVAGGDMAAPPKPSPPLLTLGARLVRHIMRRYLEVESIVELADELNRQGHRTKVQQRSSGPQRGGCIFRWCTLYHLLSNRIYRGMTVHKGKAHIGEHEAITPQALWEEV
jgi:hypothetical protein